ncbi:hypothetical protein GMD78_04445 [Ornithinibacillus sp. L9]|uniref:Uncharacterized protein n=1 Tax=Ornithinibacillus caprae TaxID=2678566 RepID=A0A6N8FIQ2_9BACI|nr:hypothetical protein [Ornithinibacillus caprae]MUK87649.1 hypothetical protein [Ornithinibacillus caprae]
MTNSRMFHDESGHAGEGSKSDQLQVRAWVKTISDPNEHKEFMERLHVGSQFDMRYRGLVEYYGDDLIAYKRKNLSSKHVNDFLYIFSKYLTDHLEDDCPPSWKEFHPQLWEEFIYACFPMYLDISLKQNKSEIFQKQLKKFIYWLDKRSGCSWYSTVEKCIEDGLEELKTCEKIFNALFLHSYPNLHQKDLNPLEDIAKIEARLQGCDTTLNSIFEVTNITDGIVSVRDIDTNTALQIAAFPTTISTGILLEGTIGMNNYDFYWTWLATQAVYPNKAQNYIQFVD